MENFILPSNTIFCVPLLSCQVRRTNLWTMGLQQSGDLPMAMATAPSIWIFLSTLLQKINSLGNREKAFLYF
jgi:hypothetical protein